ncbi:phage tail protein [Nisaea sp.]|uniref:phage tail protein n=1 Tax=Nisaea sp. TaxID=2024842 RepID=UPI003B522300
MSDTRIRRRASLLIGFVCTASALLQPLAPAKATCGPGPYIGTVCATAASFCPTGYLAMVGQEVAIASKTELFSLLGCKWGGDCRSTFGIPDMRGRTPVGAGTRPDRKLTPLELGQFRGAETVALTHKNLPAHSHKAKFKPSSDNMPANGTLEAYTAQASNDSPMPGYHISGGGTVPRFGTGGSGAQLVELNGVTVEALNPGTGDVVIEQAGSSAAVNIQDPVTALTYCIASKGFYPEQSE